MLFQIFTDPLGGDLIPIEFNEIQFQPKRIFSVSSVPKGQRRGGHAHFKTKRLFVCINGSVLVGLHDGKVQKETVLNKGDSIFVDNLIWDYQEFLTGNDFIVVLCSTNYNKSDYIEDFNQFLKIKNK